MLHIQRGNGREPPVIKRNHTDGPLLIFSDGRLLWLTWWDRARFALGLVDAWSLQRKYRPDLVHIQP